MEYRAIIDAIGPRRREGQCFLVNSSVAAFEAGYARGLSVLEMGPGLGILTKELCAVARHVTAIEKDIRLFERLRVELPLANLSLINADFLESDMEALGEFDIMVSNIPYNLSSRVVSWLWDNRMPALLCVQREFAEHMVAKPGTPSYSRLSVMSSLLFSVHSVRRVGAGEFYPVPRVDSELVYMVPKKAGLPDLTADVIRLIMNHKKKRLRNAIIDSASEFGASKARAREAADAMRMRDRRPFQMSPMEILDASKEALALGITPLRSG